MDSRTCIDKTYEDWKLNYSTSSSKDESSCNDSPSEEVGTEVPHSEAYKRKNHSPAPCSSPSPNESGGFTTSNDSKPSCNEAEMKGEGTPLVDLCDQDFSGKEKVLPTGRVKMQRLHITSEDLFECEICGRRFMWNSSMKRHLRIHTGDRPFECEICGNRFVRNSNMKRHMRMHTGERPFKCEVCGKSFTQNRNLKRHSAIHTDNKPFKCEDCGKEFTREDKLKQHLRAHTGEKPFKCEVCGRTFAVNSTLKRHLITHSGER